MPKFSLFWSRVLGPTVARYGWYLVVIPLLLANIGVLQSATARRVYVSSTSVTVGSTLTDLALGVTDSFGALLLNREVLVARSGATQSKVKMKPGTKLSGRVLPDTGQILLQARSANPKDAQDAANSFAAAYVAESGRRRLQAYKQAATYLEESLGSIEAELESAKAQDKPIYQARVNDLRARLLAARELASKPINTTVEQGGPASFPTSPTNRSPITAGILGFIFGLGICGVIILILDFSEKQRVSLDDIRETRPDLRILGVTTPRSLRGAALVGYAIKANAAATDAKVVCAAFVGARVRPGPLTRALVSSINLAGGRCIQVVPEETGQSGNLAVVPLANGTWSVAMPDQSYAVDGGDLLRKSVAEQQLDLVVVGGPFLRDNRARPAAFEMADQIVLVIDATSTSAGQVNEALSVIEAFDRPVLGALFLQR